MDQQIQQLKRAASATPLATTYFQLGQLQQAAQYLADARSSYEQALKLNPNSAEAKQALNAVGPEPTH
jgi:tetratricopeptide (TPR) repeat protein